MSEVSLPKLYTDGACSTLDPFAGGWSWALVDPDDVFVEHQSGGEFGATNQRMELLAVIRGFEAIHPTQSVMVVSDSAYVINCFNDKWYEGWLARGWKNSKGVAPDNTDLWLDLLSLWEEREEWGGVTQFKHMRGHGRGENDDPKDVFWNDHVDKLAVSAKRDLT